MNVAWIPVRGGSKSIPLKNIKELCGKPLVYWTLKAACGCADIDRVYVSTDNNRIRDVVESFINGQEAALFEKAEVIDRSEASASDTASTEFAMLEFANQYDFDNIVLIQATSPLLKSTDLDRGFAVFREEGTDSVLSVVPQKRFYWQTDENGLANPVNYDVFNRPRRQEFDGYLTENGAFYITSRKRLLESKNRISGRIRAVEMEADSFFELDEADDWTIVEELMKKQGMNVPFDIPEIELFLTDCDGCLTDGGMYYSEHGDESKKFNTHDGMGFSLLKQHGILTGIVTGETVELNRRRAEKLKLDILETGCKDKVSAIQRICAKRQIPLENVCFIGDDINDTGALKLVGFGCAPADAMPQAKDAADYVTKAKGGEGVIREVVELLFRGKIHKQM